MASVTQVSLSGCLLLLPCLPVTRRPHVLLAIIVALFTYTSAASLNASTETPALNTSSSQSKALYDRVTQGLTSITHPFPPQRTGSPVTRPPPPPVTSRLPLSSVRPASAAEDMGSAPGAMSLLYVCKLINDAASCVTHALCSRLTQPATRR